MKYIVRAQGKVYDYKHVAYDIEAESREEAERIAAERFNDKYIVADNDLSIKAGTVQIGMIAALAGLAIAAALAFIGFKTGVKKDAVTIRPDLTSLLYGAGVFLILLFKFRGIKNVFNPKELADRIKDWKSIVLDVLMIILIAAYIQLLFSQMKIGYKILSVNLDLRLLALALALIAYFGSGVLSIICLVLFILLSKISIAGLAATLGNVKGILFLISSLIGTVAFITTRPSLYQGFMNLKTFIKNPLKDIRKQNG